MHQTCLKNRSIAKLWLSLLSLALNFHSQLKLNPENEALKQMYKAYKVVENAAKLKKHFTLFLRKQRAYTSEILSTARRHMPVLEETMIGTNNFLDNY